MLSVMENDSRGIRFNLGYGESEFTVRWVTLWMCKFGVCDISSGKVE